MAERNAVSRPRKTLPTRRKVNADPAPLLAEAVTITRYWRSVAIGADDECWPWTGSTTHGYGEFFYRGRMRPAHELALSFSVGEVRPDRFDTCHSCDTPLCCNPHHLRFDTRQSNVDDMWERGRGLSGERGPGAALTAEQVVEIRTRRANGARQKDLAAHYGVSPAWISEIVNGLVWRDVGGPITGKSKRTERTSRNNQGKAA